MAEKLTRKELRAPDAFQKAGFQAREWLQSNQRLVLLLVVGALLVFGGAMLANYLSSRGEVDASKALTTALKVVERPVHAEAQAPVDPEAEAPFSTQKEKDEELIKQFAEVRQKFPRSRAAITAALLIGEAQLRLGRPDDAMKSLEDFLKAMPSDEALRVEGLEGQGYAYETKRQLDQALSTFDALSRDNKTDFLTGIGLYHRGRILIEQGKKQEAAEAFAQVSSAYPNTPVARLASDRLAVLAEEGFKPAPPPTPNLNPDAG
ncbi:MAG TPA: tetratricopeptide repeat protein [Myxococcaceae bacterium]|nr:tetratricopeptide repeat protein [Myxococcaceae bacterium]